MTTESKDQSVEEEKTDENPDLSSQAGEAAANSESEEIPEETGPVELTGQEFKELSEKAQKANEYWDRFVRLNAEFDNFKKRAARDRLDAIKYANEALIERLLPTLDHFSMAMAATEASESVNLEAIKTGVLMVHTQFKNVLSESGLEEIDAKEGSDFDPNLHEAVSQEESTSIDEGKIVRQLRQGYKLKDRMVRAASVVVAKSAETEGAVETREPSSEEAQISS
jgi:molecular chaperone GrpE